MRGRYGRHVSTIGRMWRLAGVRATDVLLPLALALLISAADGASFALLIPLSDGVAAGSFASLDRSPRLAWIGWLLPPQMASAHRDVAWALALLGLLLAGRLLKAALEVLRGWWITARDARYVAAAGQAVFRRVTEFGPLYFRRRPMAHIDTEISWGVAAIEVLTSVEALVKHVAGLVVKVVLVVAMSAYLLLSLLVSLAVLAVVNHRMARRSGLLADAGAAIEKAERRSTIDTLTNLSMVKALRGEGWASDNYGGWLRQSEAVRRDKRRLHFLESGLVEATILVGALVGEAMILAFVPGSPALHLTRFCAFFLIAQQCLPDLREGAAYVLNLAQQRPRLEALAGFFDDHAKFVVPSGPRPFSGLRRGIALEGLHFAYDPVVPVLRDLRAEVPAGRVTALVGATGSGKSTLAALIARLCDCKSGTILFDGQDVRGFDLNSLRRGVFIVGQEAWLLDRSLRQNLCFGLEGAPADAALWEVLRRVGLYGEFAARPEGLDTELGDRGAMLSGGQRRLVEIARVLLRDPDLLILDEATAALDGAAEERVMASVRAHLAGRTILVVAHRLSTIRMADHVLVLDEGRVVEAGRWEDLAASGGAFVRLLAGQLADEATEFA